jgi:glycosyltransferase involved in cell wall biosynthesis
LNLGIDEVFSRARSLTLRRFVFCSSDAAVEYEAAGSDGGSYRPTNRRALIATNPSGPWRLSLPPCWGGHVLTTSQEFTNSVFLNFDLVRRGYFHVHLISDSGTEKKYSLRLLFSALVTRARQSVQVRYKEIYKEITKPRSAILRSMATPREPTYSVVPNRILMVTPSFARGGSEQQTFNTAELLTRRGYDVCLLALRPLEPGEPGYMDEIKARNLPYRILPSTVTRDPPAEGRSDELKCYAEDLPEWLVNFFDAAVGAIKEFRPAVVHCWLDQAVAIGGLSAGILGVPRIVAHQLVMVMDDAPEAAQLHREGYLALVGRPAVKFVSNSKRGAISYERWLGFRRDTFHILNNVLAPTTVRTPDAEEVSNFRMRHGIRPEERVVSAVIRLVPQKDPALWVEAAALIAAARQDVRFLIGGYGVLADAIQAKIVGLGLSDRITMLGPVTDLGLVYAATDVFMLSSRFEGLPCVLLEAQAAGRPVVATDVGGNAEAFRDGLTGRLVRRRTPQALAQAVLEILDSPGWMRRAAAEAPRHVATSFGPDPYITKMLDIYGLAQHANEEPHRSGER